MEKYISFLSTPLNYLAVFCLFTLPVHADGNQAPKKSEQAKPAAQKSDAKPVPAAEKSGEADLMELLKRTKPVFYPECKPSPVIPVPVRVGLEDFQDKHMALSGLKGVYLNVEGLLESAGKKNVKMVDKLKDKIIQRLAKGGLKLLTEEEMLITPGQPEMSMFMSFPAHLAPVKKGGKPIAYRPDCCSMGIWTSFAQAGKILRDPDTHYKLGTWGEGHNSVDCSDPGGWMSDVILKTVESFATEKVRGDVDYAELLKGRKTTKSKPHVVKKSAPPPKKIAKVVKKHELPPPPKKVPVPPVSGDCASSGSVRMFIDMFEANQTYIGKSQAYALQQLAESMLACPMYNYIIETHADPRASLAYNEKLSALRAASIQGFLLGKGVPKERFVMKSFGELSPITFGTTVQDYAANRRVVVRPYLIIQ